jgi:hypothetical protein
MLYSELISFLTGAKPIYVATVLIPGVVIGVIQWHVLLAYYHCNFVCFFVAIG